MTVELAPVHRLHEIAEAADAEPKVYRAAKVAELFDVSVGTVYRETREGGTLADAAIHLGKSVRWSAVRIAELLGEAEK